MMFEQELHFARSVSMHAGELAVGYQTQGVTPEDKADLSPVTIADRECERMIVNRIIESFPDDGILGEEGADKPSRNGRLWIIDPIDGTRDFVRGLPLWSTLIGLEVDGEVVMGVCHMQCRGEQYSALKGQGAWLNEKAIHISSIISVSQALACVSGLNAISDLPFGHKLIEWVKPFWAVRSMGGCLDAMMLASGHAELWLEPTAKAWDLAPLKIIIEEAGGRFLNFDGGSAIRGGNAIAYVPALEGAVQHLLSAR
ncbi:MAG: histidinol phosphate phosphatase [Bryobacteraceae bacterium]|nr:histidinol phosphate phosphatase [Bryobacteraceae bacterium]